MDECTLKGLCKELFDSPTEDVATRILECVGSLHTSDTWTPSMGATGLVNHDYVAQRQVPSDALSRLSPVRVTGDGNCLFRAVSPTVQF